MSLSGTNLLGLKDLNRSEIESILNLADEFADADTDEDFAETLAGKSMLCAFFQPSTRTRLSHEAAMYRLGGKVLGFSDPHMTRAGDFYQETIKDTIKMLDNYADIIVMRHYQKGAAQEAAKWSKVPIINAGDGWGEHPTQVLTDLLTIRRRMGTLDGIKVLLLGDGRMRTMHSMGYALAHFDATVSFAAPNPFTISSSYLSEFAERGLTIELIDDVTKGLMTSDIIYIEPIAQADLFSNIAKFHDP